MASKTLHPTVEKFKEFVKANPGIGKEVKAGKFTLQELYEDWYLLGEEDSKWDPYRSEKIVTSKKEENQSDWLSNVMGTFKNIDPNQMQGYIQNLSQALGAVQGVISQFQGGGVQGANRGPTDTNSTPKPKNPFAFRKD